MIDGFRQGLRPDGRSLSDSRAFTIKTGTIPTSFGSATVTFGERDT
jgi:exosome complex RNA-binding protein Rrp42 (RNase PH superfamily)